MDEYRPLLSPAEWQAQQHFLSLVASGRGRHQQVRQVAEDLEILFGQRRASPVEVTTPQDATRLLRIREALASLGKDSEWLAGAPKAPTPPPLQQLIDSVRVMLSDREADQLSQLCRTVRLDRGGDARTAAGAARLQTSLCDRARLDDRRTLQRGRLPRPELGVTVLSKDLRTWAGPTVTSAVRRAGAAAEAVKRALS